MKRKKINNVNQENCLEIEKIPKTIVLWFLLDKNLLFIVRRDFNEFTTFSLKKTLYCGYNIRSSFS